jgi:hypothetical protein
VVGGRFVGFVPIEAARDSLIENPQAMIHVWGTNRSQRQRECGTPPPYD